MAIAPTGAIYKTFTFDSQSSSTYGVYITGAAVYNAPERDVEMIEIPGRNGAFAFDKGRFQNIEVTYPAGIFADNETNWAEAISNLRNMLCSRKGYCRLTDDYNPNEYRMAVYKSGLEVDPAQLRAGEFNITFECMPQRFLKSGETKQTIAQSGDTLTNPTLFDARPMLEISGYGNISLGGAGLSIISEPIGQMGVASSTTGRTLSGGGTQNATWSETYQYDQLMTSGQFANPGDPLTFSSGSGLTLTTVLSTNDSSKIINPSYVANMGSLATLKGVSWDYNMGGYQTVNIGIPPVSFTYGTAQTVTDAWSLDVSMNIGGTDYTGTWSYTLSLAYDGAGHITITLNLTATLLYVRTGNNWFRASGSTSCSLVSSVSALGNPIYFDLDIGEAYKLVSGMPVSVDNAVVIPAELPTLPPGATTVTYDNTITKLEIVPRWWHV